MSSLESTCEKPFSRVGVNIMIIENVLTKAVKALIHVFFIFENWTNPDIA